jgi:hypothetical protein
MSVSAFRKRALGPFFFIFLFRNLPLAFFAGVKLRSLDDQGSKTSMRFRWINKNPFRSMYFAAMHMAAELATGLMLFQHITRSTKFSMLLVETNAQFYKKSVGQITFECPNGTEIQTFIRLMLESGDGCTITLPVMAKNAQDELVGTFNYTWSCKKKST